MRTKHAQTFQFFLVAWIAAGGSLLAAAAHATPTEVPDESALQCLQRGAAPLNVTPQDMQNERGLHSSYMRVKLEFRRHDQAPTVEILANTSQALVHDKVLKYLNQYRLPCLGANGDGGPVTATQEFHFDPLGDADGKPLRLVALALDPARACVVMPKRGPEVPSFVSDGVVKVLIEASFTGDGSAAPEVKVLYADGRKAEQSVLDNLAEYRMPCRKTGDQPYKFRQNFTIAIGEAKAAKFKEPLIALPRFLRSVRGIKQQQVYFDFASMGCPFRVQWELLRPVQDNDVRSEGEQNPNRAEFLAWLKGLELDLSDRQTRALLGESMMLDVPCGVLDLRVPVPGAPT